MAGSLRVSLPSDRSEREADVVARRVLAMSGPAPLGSVIEDDVVARCPGGCECEEMIHRDGGGGRTHGEVSRSDIAGLGSGRPLSNSVREFFEPRFGADLSQVRVHTGSAADRLAARVGARAFTYHQDVVFRSGEFRPHAGQDRRLLAHELAHTVQQKPGSSRSTPQRSAGGDSATANNQLSRPISPATTIMRQGENLRASRFAGNRILELAFDGLATISQRRNSLGTHVRLIQESLLAQGYALPIHGADGDFGPETEAAVRAFQVDAGAVKLDGIVGPETMRLLDMHDPGATTGLPAALPGAAAATSAAFSESANEQFAGYDASTAPNDSLVVPVNGRRRADVAITPAGARPTFVSDTPGVATVAATRTGVVVTGVAHGTARVQAQAGAVVLDTLDVSVKNQVSHSVAFHYVCDSRPAAAGGPHCSNGTPSTDEMRSLLNRVWERQGNVLFTGGASHNIVVPGDLGPYVNDDGFGGDEMATVVAAAPAPADYNVFRVWEVRVNHSPVNNALNNTNNTLVGDAPCADGFGLPHEAGHFLGLGHGSGFIMTPCGGRTDQRVSKAMADLVNP
jgi:peptidoglycan hydrolase-like protein with peptidoglycan-binding domain